MKFGVIHGTKIPWLGFMKNSMMKIEHNPVLVRLLSWGRENQVGNGNTEHWWQNDIWQENEILSKLDPHYII
jgi:hypothetical protein